MESRGIRQHIPGSTRSKQIYERSTAKNIAEGYKDGFLEQEKHIHNQLEERRRQEEILWKQNQGSDG